MSYTYDYTKAPASDIAVKRYWRSLQMTLTRCIRKNTFHFDGKDYEYLYHPYNRTWKNERGIEIPIFRELLLSYSGKRVLELGNVMSHYVSIHHDIVDKYEVAPGVINEDIAEFVPQQQYDLIISISTLEHVGWDEEPREPAKLFRVIEHLRSTCLAPSGTLIVSLPIGYNRYLDDLLDSGKSPFTVQHFLKRVSKQNYWSEAEWEQCRDLSYGRSVAHAICIGVIRG